MEVFISLQADADIAEAQTYFDSDGREIGERFHQDVLETLGYIAQFPGGAQIRSGHFRFAPLGKFKYIFIYSIEVDCVVVHRLRHMRRRPLKRYFGD